NPSFMKCYGITRNNDGKYMIILKYAEAGSLRSNIDLVSKLKWKDKLNLLQSIAYDLKIIHSSNIIHRDLHSGNILQDNLHSAYISDLGLSIQYFNENDNEVYGILPYVAPEILNKKPYTTSSDIYSFGMIMWEVLYGQCITNYYKLNDASEIMQETMQIFEGKTPPINKEAPQFYVNLMKRCWSKVSENRPSACELCEMFERWQDDEQIITELNKFDPLKLLQYYIDMIKLFFNEDLQIFSELDPKLLSKKNFNSKKISNLQSQQPNLSISSSDFK
ncbi:kinase-like domain-containing protein, partial [Gigaspora rosea]